MGNKNIELVISIIIILIGAFVTSEVLRWIIKRAAKVNSSKIKVDPTNYTFLKNTISFVIYSIAFALVFYSIPSLKALGATLFAGAGIFAAIIALASQQAFSNIISGIFIVISKPFRVGDYIELSLLHRGTVEDITLRHTVIRDIQNNRIIVPNAKINSETIVNYHLNDERKKEEILNHKGYLELKNENPESSELIVRVTKIENGTITLRTMVGSEDPEKAFEMHCDLNYSIKKRFDSEGVKFAQRTAFATL